MRTHLATALALLLAGCIGPQPRTVVLRELLQAAPHLGPGPAIAVATVNGRGYTKVDEVPSGWVAVKVPNGMEIGAQGLPVKADGPRVVRVIDPIPGEGLYVAAPSLPAALVTPGPVEVAGTGWSGHLSVSVAAGAAGGGATLRVVPRTPGSTGTVITGEELWFLDGLEHSWDDKHPEVTVIAVKARRE